MFSKKDITAFKNTIAEIHEKALENGDEDVIIDSKIAFKELDKK